MSEQSKRDADDEPQPSSAPKKVIAARNRPNPMGTAVDRLIGQLVPELRQESDAAGDRPDGRDG